jgi:hypothetical protein
MCFLHIIYIYIIFKSQIKIQPDDPWDFLTVFKVQVELTEVAHSSKKKKKKESQEKDFVSY